MNRTLVIAGIAVIAAGIVAANSLFTVDETEQALVLQFGQPVNVISRPGLNVKIPLIQNVVYMERRVLDIEPPSEQLILADQRRLEVDTFVRYQIRDPLRFYQTVGSEITAQTRLSNIATSTLRRVLGSATQIQVLSDERSRLMEEITRQVNAEAQTFGVQIVDVRIRRADVPDATTQNIFARMRSEREREASEFRAQGQEQSQQIRSRADRERTVLLAEAQRDAQTLRGEGDNRAIRVLAEATAQDQTFYNFYRTLQAYRTSFRNDDTTLVLSPQGDFFRYFSGRNGPLDGTGGRPPAIAPTSAAAPTTAALPGAPAEVRPGN
jgi:modulator of FtsH protease HflC